MNKHTQNKSKKVSEVQFGAKLPSSLVKSIKKYAVDHEISIKDLVKIAMGINIHLINLVGGEQPHWDHYRQGEDSLFSEMLVEDFPCEIFKTAPQNNFD